MNVDSYVELGENVYYHILHSDTLIHSGHRGMKWYKHVYGDWQKHAKYANGMPDPSAGTTGSAKFIMSELSKPRWGYMSYKTVMRRAKSGRRIETQEERKARVRKAFESEYKPLDAKTRFLDSEEDEIRHDVKTVNGGMIGTIYGKDRQNNCAHCSTAYELRRRGYDVKANTSIGGVDLVNNSDLIFKNAKSETFVAAKDNKEFGYFYKKGVTQEEFKSAEEKLVKEQGEGARGTIYGGWRSGRGAHSMAYEIKDGKMQIADCQLGKIYKDPYKAVKDMSYVNTIRLDDKDFNRDVISTFVVNSKDAKMKVDTAKVAETILASAFFIPKINYPAYIALSGLIEGNRLYKNEKEVKYYRNHI